MRTFIPFAFALLSACSPPVTTDAGNDTGTTDSLVADASDATNPPDVIDVANNDVLPADVQARACGTTTCSGNEVCVHPCCGGALPPCIPPDDAGACPSGTTFGPCFNGGSGPGTGCAATCTPPAPFCASRPDAGCMGTTCPVCPTGSGVINGDEISCLCA